MDINNVSVFLISPEKLKLILIRFSVIQSPSEPIIGGQFVRSVNAGEVIGKTSQNYGGTDTTLIKIITDRAGNLITVYPVPAP